MTYFLVFFGAALISGITSSHPYAKTRCFDCNYAPSGYGKTKAGALQCALRNYDNDAASLDQWGCKSGKCFVRMDKNGFVYRGCADEMNLPFGVDTSKQCAHQAGSVWQFCDGDLCNKDQIGEICGYKAPNKKPRKGYNPCDGKCYGNPSGLFPDKSDKNSFIQCGCGSDDHGNTCTCCVPFYFRCPYGSMFDSYLKTCVADSYGAH